MDVVYTAIYGGYDPLRPVPLQCRRKGLRYLCFTDDPTLEADGWEIRLTRCDTDPWRESKLVKLLPHIFLPAETERSIWLDGSVAMRRCPANIFDRVQTDIGLFRHRQRNCLYKEARICREKKKDKANRILGQVIRYRAAGHPKDFGLWMGGIIFRRHTEQVAEFNKFWLRQVGEGSRRDQISLPYAIRQTGLDVTTLPDNVRGAYFQIRPHARRPR